MLDDVSTALTTGISLTPAAAGKLGEIIHQKGLASSYGLRVFVQGGGCGGMQYGMTFDDSPREDDEVYEQHGLKVIIDPISLFYINGARIDWVDSLMGGGFNIENPNATSSCGCGSSFRTSHSHTGQEMPSSCAN
ncbi:MAG: iron-sulfur cluster insertion protein ErpA [Caldilineales bacterium]|nr:iron-sulfur cluster insertion protein ErpA [Caldilineales bacterium]